MATSVLWLACLESSGQSGLVTLAVLGKLNVRTCRHYLTHHLHSPHLHLFTVHHTPSTRLTHLTTRTVYTTQSMPWGHTQSSLPQPRPASHDN